MAPLAEPRARVALTCYSVGLIYYLHHSLPTVTIGATYEFIESDHAVRLVKVASAGPAEQAGLRNGDVIVAVNGRPSTSMYPIWDAIDAGGQVRRFSSASADLAIRTSVTFLSDSIRLRFHLALGRP